jgi:hypothetical protein
MTLKHVHLGKRKVSDMNYSKIVTLPKAFTDNYLDESRIVEMSMTPQRQVNPNACQKRKARRG